MQGTSTARGSHCEGAGGYTAAFMLLGGGIQGSLGSRGWRGAQVVPSMERGVFPSRSSGRVRLRCWELLETMQIPPAPASCASHPGLTTCLRITMNLKAPAQNNTLLLLIIISRGNL